MISVALCTFNGEKYLEEQLMSILNQSKMVHELVVYDDGSTDNTPIILENFKSKAPFPVYLNFNKKNLGVIRNFELCLKACSGEYIFLCDQDDYWESSKVAVQLAYLQKNPDKMAVFSNAHLMDDSSNLIGETSFERIQFGPGTQELFKKKSGAFELLLNGYLVTGAALLIRKSIINRILPFPEIIPELIHDAWIGFYLSMFDELGFITDPLIKYRTHTNQQVGLVGKERKITIKDRFIRGRQARLERIEKKMIHAQRLSHTISQLENIPSDIIRRLEKRYKFYEFRLRLPKLRVLRFFPILIQFLNGHYKENENGKYYRTALSDLVES